MSSFRKMTRTRLRRLAPVDLRAAVELRRRLVKEGVTVSDCTCVRPDEGGWYWFVFDESEAKGAVGVRRDNWGLGVYLKPEAVGLAATEGPVRVASVDLFHMREEEEVPFVQLVVDDIAGEEIVLVARFTPGQHTAVDQHAVESERRLDVETRPALRIVKREESA